MKFIHCVFFVLMAPSIMTEVLSDLMDVAASSVFSTSEKKIISCYECVNTTSRHCNEIDSKSSAFIKECKPGANGCIKRFFIDDGYTIMSRECYYGPVKIFHDFGCEGTKVRYQQEMCYMCSDNLCNSSNNLYTAFNMYNLWILLTTCLILHISTRVEL